MADDSPLAQVAEWAAPHAAVAVVDAHGVLEAWGPRERVFPLASVTKLLSATAVLLAVEDGRVDLEEAAGPPGSTVRHLLAHASGLSPDGTVVLAPVGRRRIYSNAGFEILGELISARVGSSFATYLRERVTAPMSLRSMRLDGSAGWGARCDVIDLARFGREMLAPAVLPPAVVDRAREPTFPDLPGILPGFGRQEPNDWGLGFELRGRKQPHWTGTRNSPRTFGHFGRSGTFLWVDPDAGLACACLTDLEFGSWAQAAWPALSDAVLAHFSAGVVERIAE